MIRGGRDVTSSPRTGLQEGGQKNGVQPRGGGEGQAVEGKLYRRRMQAAEGVGVGEIRHQGLESIRASKAAIGIHLRNEGVEIPHQQGGDRAGGDGGPQGGEQGLPLEELVVVLSRRRMKVDEREAPGGDNLGDPWGKFLGGGAGDGGKSGDDAAIEAGSEELVPTRGRHSCQGSSIVDLLQKNQVRAVELEKGRQASQVPPLLGVVGEEGEEGSELPPTRADPSRPLHLD